VTLTAHGADTAHENGSDLVQQDQSRSVGLTGFEPATP
jgi:hypothetical protein